MLRQVHALYPHSPCLYLGDTARVPYGQRSKEEIRAIASEVVHWLRLQGVGVLVMACNTSNALALDVAVAEAGVPVVGLIDSLASELTSDHVGVLATPATAASGAYRRSIQACRPSARVLEVGCPAFVPLIEAGDLQAPELRAAATGYLAPLLAANVDTIVLGCTHYPLLRALLAELLPPDVQLVDPALAAAQRLGPLLASLGDSPEVDQAGSRCGRPCSAPASVSPAPPTPLPARPPPGLAAGRRCAASASSRPPAPIEARPLGSFHRGGDVATVAELLQPVESDLDALLADLRSLIGAGHPILQAAAEHLFAAGGKRLRPGIVLLLSRAIAPDGGLSPRHRRLAEITEMIHTASSSTTTWSTGPPPAGGGHGAQPLQPPRGGAGR